MIFGLDGADLDLIAPWLEEGRLPCLSRLAREGVCQRLATTIPPLSPEAWSTFATGCNPGKHGVVNFVQPKPNSYELAFSNGATRRGPAFWELAGASGIKVGLANIPMTFPPRPVNGFMLAGFDAPGVQSEYTYPRELKQELTQAVGRYELHGDFWGQVTPRQYLERLVGAVENHRRAWVYLIKRYQPQLFAGVVGSTDRAQHFLWRYADPSHPDYDGTTFGGENPLLTVYQAADRALADCLEAMGEEVTVVVLSDHGGGPCSKTVFLDRWLERNGFLAYLPSGESPARALLRRGYGLARKHLPRNLKDLLKSKLGGVRQRLEGSSLRAPLDWSRTRAFFTGTESAYLYLNMRGRFPEGIVDPGPEAETVRQELREGLLALRDPEDGQPVVGSIHLREEIYWGRAEDLALLPDLVVNWRDFRYVTRRAWGEPEAPPEAIVVPGTRAGEAGRLMTLSLSGCHRGRGVLIAAGPRVRPGARANAHLMDLAPTALSLLGVEIPRDMDGQALEAHFLLAPAEKAAR